MRLLVAGIRVDEKSLVKEATALHYAASEGHTSVLQYLLKAGVDINARNWQGKTPLHTATHHGRKEIVAVLLELGAAVDELYAGWLSALHRALEINDHEIV